MSNKTFALLIIILGLASSVYLAYSKWLAPQEASLETYDTKLYTIKYPKDWQIKDEDSNFGSVRFTPPETDCRICGFGVSAFQVPFSTEEYTENLINNMDVYRGSLISSEDKELSGKKAHQLVYQAPEGKETYQWMRVYVVQDSTLYDVGFSFPKDQFPRHKETIGQMIESFQIK